MRTLVHISAVVICIVTCLSCGHTILQDRPATMQEQQPSEEVLPDLVITGVTNRTELVQWMDAPEPTVTCQFWIQIANRGSAPFAGRVAVAWTDDGDEIRYRMFRYLGDEEYVILPPDSTTTLRATLENFSYPPGTRLLFTVMSDIWEKGTTGPSYKFGSMPYRELSFENNIKEYIVQ